MFSCSRAVTRAVAAVRRVVSWSRSVLNAATAAVCCVSKAVTAVTRAISSGIWATPSFPSPFSRGTSVGRLVTGTLSTVAAEAAATARNA